MLRGAFIPFAAWQARLNPDRPLASIKTLGNLRGVRILQARCLGGFGRRKQLLRRALKAEDKLQARRLESL